MRILVDTCIWSAAIRRRHPDVQARQLITELIAEGRLIIIGPIRQEILSGISSMDHYERLRSHLAAFPDHQLTTADYERAASLFNQCRRNGVQGSTTDFVICSVAIGYGFQIFSTDVDFQHYQRCIPITLFPFS